MKILLVDDEAHVLRGVSRMIECEADHWEVETALSGSDAIKMLEGDRFNVVVSDMSMPEMDGAELLEIVEQRFPNVLRIVLSGQADRKSVLRAIKPMHQYLAKPCDPDVLINIIRRAEVFQQMITSVEVLDAIGKANCLPTIPKMIEEIDREINSDVSTTASLAKVISKDPILAGKLLQLANSAIFGQRHQVVEIEQCLSLIGTELVKAVAISLAVFSPSQTGDIEKVNHLFAHSVEVANMARRIAKWESVDSTTLNTVLSGGLLHDIGKMVLWNAFPDRYQKVLQRKQAEGIALWRCELEEFGASHSGIGAYLLELWGVPESLIQTVATHHSLDICARSSQACQILFAANWIANGCEGEIEETAIPESDFRGHASVEELADFRSKLAQWGQRACDESEEAHNGN
ncbi:response regulator [Rhodopirellula sp. MGV]|uniref:response regulator n=1 Tax=Rhodopirellula sp. MGV TaxID=2023130 RepID=UPI000B967BB6|nr:response regulator [Rhodopirellula sp. MGV]OYP33167.1 hypothetical protein CGZ80_18260 [Rhodopirellula sp. MGV]PNY35103.1 HDOD domain-containing protein [Rhodopirellula baltica]